MDQTFLIVVAGSAIAGFVQGMTGFAFGLVAMAIWAWSLDPTLAAPLVVCGSIIGQLFAARAVLSGTDPWRAVPFVIGGAAGVPIGVILLRYIDPAAFRASVGILLMVWCPVMMFARDLPRVRWGGRLADAVIGWIAGIMGGLGGLTGPAPILWATLRGWDRYAQRGVFLVFNLCMHSLTMTLYIASGTVTRRAAYLFAAMVPAMILPSIAGYRLYRRLSETMFRRVVLGLLAASGVVLVISSRL